jgi:hypothetical protein
MFKLSSENNDKFKGTLTVPVNFFEVYLNDSLELCSLHNLLQG